MTRQGDGPPLSASERHHYQVVRVLSSNEIELGPSEHEFADDNYQLTSDSHARNSWNKLGLTVPVRPPVSAGVLGHRFLTTVARSVEAVTQRASRPSVRAPGEPVPLPKPRAVFEIEFSCALFEADIFAGGIVSSGSQSARILYSTSVSNAYARIGVEKGATFRTGARLELKPAEVPDDSGDALYTTQRVVALVLQGQFPKQEAYGLGGDIAIDVDGPDVQKTYITRLLSPILPLGGETSQVVVRMSADAESAVHAGKWRCRYYPPYEIDLTINHGGGSSSAANTIAIPFTAGQSRQNLYLAATTRDRQDNEGPLSTPALAVLLRPPPTGAPQPALSVWPICCRRGRLRHTS